MKVCFRRALALLLGASFLVNPNCAASISGSVRPPELRHPFAFERQALSASAEEFRIPLIANWPERRWVSRVWRGGALAGLAMSAALISFGQNQPPPFDPRNSVQLELEDGSFKDQVVPFVMDLQKLGNSFLVELARAKSPDAQYMEMFQRFLYWHVMVTTWQNDEAPVMVNYQLSGAVIDRQIGLNRARLQTLLAKTLSGDPDSRRKLRETFIEAGKILVAEDGSHLRKAIEEGLARTPSASPAHRALEMVRQRPQDHVVIAVGSQYRAAMVPVTLIQGNQRIPHVSITLSSFIFRDFLSRRAKPQDRDLANLGLTLMLTKEASSARQYITRPRISDERNAMQNELPMHPTDVELAKKFIAHQDVIESAGFEAVLDLCQHLGLTSQRARAYAAQAGATDLGSLMGSTAQILEVTEKLQGSERRKMLRRYVLFAEIQPMFPQLYNLVVKDAVQRGWIASDNQGKKVLGAPAYDFLMQPAYTGEDPSDLSMTGFLWPAAWLCLLWPFFRGGRWDVWSSADEGLSGEPSSVESPLPAVELQKIVQWTDTHLKAQIRTNGHTRTLDLQYRRRAISLRRWEARPLARAESRPAYVEVGREREWENRHHAVLTDPSLLEISGFEFTYEIYRGEQLLGKGVFYNAQKFVRLQLNVEPRHGASEDGLLDLALIKTCMVGQGWKNKFIIANIYAGNSLQSILGDEFGGVFASVPAKAEQPGLANGRSPNHIIDTNDTLDAAARMAPKAWALAAQASPATSTVNGTLADRLYARTHYADNPLTELQQKILEYMARGHLSRTEMAEHFARSENSIAENLSAIRDTLNAGKYEIGPLLVQAVRLGWITLPPALVSVVHGVRSELSNFERTIVLSFAQSGAPSLRVFAAWLTQTGQKKVKPNNVQSRAYMIDKKFQNAVLPEALNGWRLGIWQIIAVEAMDGSDPLAHPAATQVPHHHLDGPGFTERAA